MGAHAIQSARAPVRAVDVRLGDGPWTPTPLAQSLLGESLTYNTIQAHSLFRRLQNEPAVSLGAYVHDKLAAMCAISRGALAVSPRCSACLLELPAPELGSRGTPCLGPSPASSEIETPSKGLDACHLPRTTSPDTHGGQSPRTSSPARVLEDQPELLCLPTSLRVLDLDSWVSWPKACGSPCGWCRVAVGLTKYLSRRCGTSYCVGDASA